MGNASITRYGVTHEGHDVQLEFDQKLVVLNRARLIVDGEEVDAAKVVYGDKDLRTTAADGTEIALQIHSGTVGELVRPASSGGRLAAPHTRSRLGEGRPRGFDGASDVEISVAVGPRAVEFGSSEGLCCGRSGSDDDGDQYPDCGALWTQQDMVSDSRSTLL